jgi:hypothetical protein
MKCQKEKSNKDSLHFCLHPAFFKFPLFLELKRNWRFSGQDRPSDKVLIFFKSLVEKQFCEVWKT